MAIILSPLPYADDALAPVISATTLQTHHGKHHRTYVDRTNTAIEGTDLAGKSLEDIVAAAIATGNKGCSTTVRRPGTTGFTGTA